MEDSLYQSLTRTELEVLRLLGGGSRPGEIARQLGRSVSTVNNHLQSARSKLRLSDSLSASRLVLAYEAARQSVPSHELPMAPDRPPPLANPLQQSVAWAPGTLHEDRVAFAHGPVDHPSWSRGAGGEWGSGAATGRWRRLGAILCLTLLLVAAIALAPAMAETFQLIIDALYPLKH